MFKWAQNDHAKNGMFQRHSLNVTDILVHSLDHCGKVPPNGGTVVTMRFIAKSKTYSIFILFYFRITYMILEILICLEDMQCNNNLFSW